MTAEVERIYTWWFDAGSIIFRYFAFAGIGYFVFYIWKQQIFSQYKIQRKVAHLASIHKEIFYSSITLLFYCATSWLVFELNNKGYTRIYIDIHKHSIAYFIFSVVIMIILHDAYFYWVHRLMHLPMLFKWVHRTHHLSDNPTPWAAFSFHPLEAILSVGIIPLIVLFIPCHPFALFAFLTYMTLINVMGHLGYELFPKRFRQSRIGKWQNTSTNHNLHHQLSRSNFGLYFTFWDKWMRTYEQKETN
jgi:sterol desaturase/sphingolipid hydroxylase (fatty acid hydroxylase superfamily)